MYQFGIDAGHDHGWDTGYYQGRRRGLRAGTHGSDLVAWHIDGGGPLSRETSEHLDLPSTLGWHSSLMVRGGGHLPHQGLSL